MKKKHLLICAVLIAAVVFGACQNKNTGNFPGEENFDKDASYALGMNLGANLREGMLADGMVPNFDEFINGLKDSLSGRDTRLDMEEAINLLNAAFNALNENKNAPLMQQEIEFLAQNALKPGVIITSSGLQYEILTESSGPRPSLNDTIQIHYEGRFADGSLFDSTYEYGEPAEFLVGDIFAGWAEGLQLMTVGSKYKFYIPSEIAFGSGGGGMVPPYATLIFTVELLDIL